MIALLSEHFDFEDLKYPLTLSQLSLLEQFNNHVDEIELRLTVRALWFKTLGVLEKPYLKKSRKPEELLCRCVGVYQGDIKELLLANTELTFDQMIHQSTAASTCMSCLDDLKKSWQKTLDHTPTLKPIDSAGRRYRPLNKTPADFALHLDEHLKIWMKREKIPTEMQIELSGLSGLQIQCRVVGTERALDYLKALEEYWRSTLGVSVQVSLEI